MLDTIKKIFTKKTEGSVHITDDRIIRKFTSNPDFPYLVSFPRTGSHWLRMMMELYFEKPSLTRAFYYHAPKDFTSYHHHDEDLKLFRPNVIYLYRKPVPTVFSQMTYYKEDLDDQSRIIYWSELYARHLSKWLITDNFTNMKTVLRYEELMDNLDSEFAKICVHLGAQFNPRKLHKVSAQVSKEKLKEKTTHDSQVVNLSNEYDNRRKDFYRNSQLIEQRMLAIDPGLKAFI
jgi:hypothetical protein